ncbi:HEPN/Toprim-associated domain-containing protein [Stutzerimonas stutzeri]|uniref:HEPN/Toprim-associated domain-containing protein n=1 Tax=Stutzerimonas stutzeri TaxID=316 RepID=UPI002109E32B|nr:HEPN/Toprim-associated domain-containing protein [Stutzerimonas stutzeri]MCQ4241492.1 HEPN/Toprim-associated domain-containing protein [Stutzerimonas stutzeri]
MGTIIDLTVGGVVVDWSKNSRGIDHGALFQEGDRKRLRSEQIDYGYFDQNNLSPADMEMAFSRSLRTLVPRLELLGFRLETVHQMYQQLAKQWQEDQAALAGNDDTLVEPLSFEEFLSFVRANPIRVLDDSFVHEIDAEAERRIRGRFDADENVARIPANPEHSSNAYSERSFFGVLIDFLHPYAALRLLAETPSNLDLDVVWQYGPLVDAGWVDVSEFVACARRAQTVLIATEGTSDVHILSRAIELLRPEVADFFRFIDVSERHPFSGTGSLVKFAEGLAKIDVQNQVIFLFDNDAEGIDAYEAIRRFKLPHNMRTLVLPELEEFRRFPARGPNGVTDCDINGRAAAIECYLDLNLREYGPAKVVWTNYKKERDIYQGSLEYKDSYTRAFLEQTTESVRSGSYDVSKLERVLDVVIGESSRLAMAVRTSSA